MDSTFEAKVDKAAAVYSPLALKVYDGLVLKFSNRFLWQCPSDQILALYNRYISSHHLEVGVGTGYFLDRCVFPDASPAITLLDLSEHCLAKTAHRIKRYQPVSVKHNVFEVIPSSVGAFESIAINYVLHCIPGSMIEKASVFDNLKSRLKPGGVLFGSTILSSGDTVHSRVSAEQDVSLTHRGLQTISDAGAQRLMALYNRKGIFNNQNDHLDALTRVLQQRFNDVKVRVHGRVALFVASDNALK
ncbi:MAG: class I SAM-dependent methyltransferase [Pseudomonadales bacterium]|nr:class I SAM-dependent methyltransferase [Pseudomonadales bacterium]